MLNHLEFCPQVCPQLLLLPGTFENFALGLPLMRFEDIPRGAYVHVEDSSAWEDVFDAVAGADPRRELRVIAQRAEQCPVTCLLYLLKHQAGKGW